jgi:transglutaminase superfamily protein
MSAATAQTTVQDVVWAVRRVSRAVPGATCLTQALAAQVLLSRRGYASRLRIGVAHAPGDGLRAHAWLESDGLIVLGGAPVEAYTPLSAAAPDGEDLFVRHVSAVAVNTGALGRGASRPPGRNRQLTMGDQ